MTDHLHAYNVEVSAACKAHRDAIRVAANIYAQAHAVLLTAHEQRLANAARTYRAALKAADKAYSEAVGHDDNDPPF